MVAARCYESLTRIRCCPHFVYIEDMHCLESTNRKWAICATISLDCVEGSGRICSDLLSADPATPIACEENIRHDSRPRQNNSIL